MSTLFGENGDIIFPKLNKEINMITFSEIAEKFLEDNGYEPYFCASEEEARNRVHELKKQKKWACYFSASDTTGEKEYEEFFIESEDVNLNRFESLGVVTNRASTSQRKLDFFLDEIAQMKKNKQWTRDQLVALFKELLPEFTHYEKGKFLDGKM